MSWDRVVSAASESAPCHRSKIESPFAIALITALLNEEDPPGHPAPVIITALTLQLINYIAILFYVIMWWIAVGWQHAWCVVQPIVRNWRLLDNCLRSVCSKKGQIAY